MLQIGGVAGTFALGIIDRFVSRAGAGVFRRGFRGRRDRPSSGTPSSSPWRSSPPAFVIVGGQIAANALAAGFYPTSVRATGVGWALGIGRVGSIVGPLIGGALLTAKWSTASVFAAAALAALCAALAAFCLSRLAGMGGSGKGAAEQPASFEAGLRPSTTAGT